MYTANSHLNLKLIPQLLNNLAVNACDIMLKPTHKSKLHKICNYYNNNKITCL